MRVATYYANDDVRIEEAEKPGLERAELLVRIEASGICGTDVLSWYRAHKVPLVLGHEVTGEVVEVGSDVADYAAGDRVAVAHHVPCDDCHYCEFGHETVCDTLRTTNFEPGGFAEYVKLPGINVEKGVFRLPDAVSYEEGVFVEPLACIIRGQRVANLRRGQSVLVLGSGVSGILHMQLAKFAGAGPVVVTDINEYRLDKARQLGADLALAADDDIAASFSQLNGGRLADLVVATTGATGAIADGLAALERGGTFLFFAPTAPGETIDLSVNDLFWRNETTLTSSYGGSPQDYRDALDVISKGKLELTEMITHRLPLDGIEEGFKLVDQARESLKVVVKPGL